MENWYPKNIIAGGFGEEYNIGTIDFIMHQSGFSEVLDKRTLNFAEVGIWKGGTSYKLAEFLENKGTLYLFDYTDSVNYVIDRLNEKGFNNIKGFGSTQKYLDSYNWELGKLIAGTNHPIFDYVFLDGAHTWAIDALAFFLLDRLVKVGGYIDLDDYNWSLKGSSLDPEKIPETELLYTKEQIESKQIKMIIDTLILTSNNYIEVVKNKIYKKIL